MTIKIGVINTVLWCACLQFFSIQNLMAEQKQATQVLKPPLVEISPVKAYGHFYTINGQGFLRAENTIDMVSEVPGIVDYLHPQLYVGGRLKKGDIVFKIESTAYEADLAQTTATIASAAAARQLAELTYKRQQSLFAKKLIAKSTLEDAQVSLSAAKAQEQQAIAIQTQAQQKLADTQVLAPFDAQVLSENLSIGQYVTSTQAVARIFDTNNAEITIGLEKSKAIAVRAALQHDNSDKSIKITSHPNLKAVFKSVAPALALKSRTMELIITIPAGFKNNPDQLIINDYINLSLPAYSDSPLFQAPSEVLRRQDSVFQIKDNRLIAVPVEVKSRFDKTVIFTSKKLDPQLSVMLTKLSKEENGLAVRVRGQHE